MIRRPPRSTLSSSSAASDVYKRQVSTQSTGERRIPIMVRSVLVALLLLAVSLADAAEGAKPVTPPAAAAAAPKPPVDHSAAALKKAVAEVSSLKAASKQHQDRAELLQKQLAKSEATANKAKQHQDKAELLQRQLEKAEATANKYREQTASLNKEVQEARAQGASAKEALKLARDQLSAAEAKIVQAETQRASMGNELQNEWAGKLQAAQQSTEAAKAELSKANKATAALKAVVEAADVQTYLQMRDMTADGAEYASKATAQVLEAASDYTESASSVLGTNYDVAWTEAHRLAAEASPMANELHQQVLTQGAPVLSQAKQAASQGLASATAAVREVLESVEATKPYAAEGSWWLVVGVAGFPVVLVGFFLFKFFVSLTSALLLKMQYAGVFFMLGAVLTTHNLAAATNSDPISMLRRSHPALDAQAHTALAAIAGTLSALHFITLVARDNGGKSIKAQFASMIAAVLVVVVSCHYYFLVYLKRADPKFEIQLAYSADGHPSYFEYSLFFAALVLFTGLGLPHGFRFSARALYTAIESGFAGALASLCVFSAVNEDAFSAALSQPTYRYSCLGLAALLVLVLAYRMLKKLGKGPIGGVLAAVHLAVVCRVLFLVKQMAEQHTPVGHKLKYATAGLLFVSTVHLFWLLSLIHISEPTRPY
eukprot:TRINITY_DN2339_c0_g1_i1.p1 TRINITY_DN2339_c0_g1~~TRINITY_DN2339_c0_g1_i1.p1  ORF type:complete len:659 (-),score=250.37 TRINITY_DN2339_c0_g1_i1:59-2035(-)